MDISIALTMWKPKIIKQAVTDHREMMNLKQGIESFGLQWLNRSKWGTFEGEIKNEFFSS